MNQCSQLNIIYRKISPTHHPMHDNAVFCPIHSINLFESFMNDALKEN